MKTLLVGDTHLMSRLILPRVNKVVSELQINRIIMMGDYTDQWGGIMRDEWYKDDLRLLYKWKQEMTSQGIEVIMLAGNHDVPYLIDKQVYYSVSNPITFDWVKEMLFDLELQIAYQLDDHLVSHAGYTEDYRLEEWHLKSLTPEYKNELIWLDNHVGLSRNGMYITGSPIWADLNHDLNKFFNHKHQKQIVGHTPVEAINMNRTIIGIDTFSLTRDYRPLGNGDLLLYENGSLTIIKNPKWQSENNQELINRYFQEM